MRIKRFITTAALALMALALIAMAGCASETTEAQPILDPTAAAQDLQSQQDEHNPTTIEPIEQGSIGIPAPGTDDTKETIVVLDGALDGDAPIADGEQLFIEGESREGADPDTAVIHELPDGDPNAVDNDDPPAILPVKEVPDGSGLVSSGFPNPDSCENALPPAREPFELKTRSATDSASADNPAITAMCTAWYVSDVDEHSVSVAVITMNSDEAASAHYELLQSQFVDSGVKFDEQRSRNRDWLTATVDQGGIGAMAIVRVGSNLVSVHNGPTSDQPQWNIDWMLDLADSTVERLN